MTIFFCIEGHLILKCTYPEMTNLPMYIPYECFQAYLHCNVCIDKYAHVLHHCGFILYFHNDDTFVYWRTSWMEFGNIKQRFLRLIPIDVWYISQVVITHVVGCNVRVIATIVQYQQLGCWQKFIYKTCVRKLFVVHDDVIKCIHFSRCWPFVRVIHRLPVNSPHKGQWCGALVFSLISWINGWVNNREAGDLRRHRAHYDATVMYGLFILGYNPGTALRKINSCSL